MYVIMSSYLCCHGDPRTKFDLLKIRTIINMATIQLQIV